MELWLGDTTWLCHNRLFRLRLRTKDKHGGKFQAALLQLFLFIGQYSGNFLLSEEAESLEAEAPSD